MNGEPRKEGRRAGLFPNTGTQGVNNGEPRKEERTAGLSPNTGTQGVNDWGALGRRGEELVVPKHRCPRSQHSLTTTATKDKQVPELLCWVEKLQGRH